MVGGLFFILPGWIGLSDKHANVSKAVTLTKGLNYPENGIEPPNTPPKVGTSKR